MKIAERIRLKILERNLANAYRECCKGLYKDGMFTRTASFSRIPTSGYFHINKMNVVNYSSALRRMGEDPTRVLLEAARRMDSRKEPIALFYGLFDVDDLTFRPSQERIARIEKNLMYVSIVPEEQLPMR